MCGWVVGWGGMGEGDLRLIALWYVRAMSCSRLEARRLHLLLGFSS